MDRKALIPPIASPDHGFVVVGTACIGLLIHLFWKPLDLIAIVLVILGLIPWIGGILSTAELPGGWKFQFRQIETTQVQQQLQIDSLQFLVTNFLTQHEVEHLQKLGRDEPFPTKKNETSQFFKEELHHLIALNLIERKPGKGLRTLIREDGQEEDVRNHFSITNTGRSYLELRANYNKVAKIGKS